MSEPSSAESAAQESGSLFSGRTIWHKRTALRDFLRTETGSASVLAGATVTSGPRVERVVLVLAGAGLAGYALLAFTNVFVP